MHCWERSRFCRCGTALTGRRGSLLLQAEVDGLGSGDLPERTLRAEELRHSGGTSNRAAGGGAPAGGRRGPDIWGAGFCTWA